MAALDLTDGFAGRGDDVYAALVRGHARLVLILANQVRDPARVIEAIRLARASARPPEAG